MIRSGQSPIEECARMYSTYHIMAHIILTLIYPTDVKVWWAVWAMISSQNPDIKRGLNMDLRSTSNKIAISSRLLSRLREEAILNRSGKNSPNFGRKKSEEEKALLSLRALNRSEQARKNIADGRRGIPFPDDAKPKVSKALTGRKASEESKALRRGRFSGGKNGMSKQVMSPDGKVYNSVKEAATAYDINYKNLSRLLHKKDTRGWKFLNNGIGNSGNKGKTRKIVSPSGKVFNSISEACKEENVCRSVIRSRLLDPSIDWNYLND